jgi:uncharacterized protein (DUF736 family)
LEPSPVATTAATKANSRRSPSAPKSQFSPSATSRHPTQGVEIGAGWLRKGQTSGKEYVALSLAAPEFGARTLYTNLGRQAGQDDPNVFALIWNPQE